MLWLAASREHWPKAMHEVPLCVKNLERMKKRHETVTAKTEWYKPY
jgi:hypothetical protein